MSESIVGFIGLGMMGSAMTAQLAKAGCRLAVYDLDARPCEELARSYNTIRVANSPADVASEADVVITMLPSGREVREVTLGENGLIGALRPGSILLDTSSSEPWITHELAELLAERGIAMVDAPVSGGAVAANAADLVFMMGGSDEDVARAQAVLRPIGQKMFHLGPLGSGHIMKSINNTITAVILVATGEGLLTGKALGLDPEVMTKVLIESTATSWIARTHIAQRIISRTFDEAFQLDLMVKDIGIAAGLAEQAGLELPIWSSTAAVWRAAQAAMPAGSTVSHVVRHMELLSGIELTPGSAPAVQVDAEAAPA
jgi:3-hydroxyisobutyrate dehydrogenase-like beta-hydroxyacid dehydrogenase